MNPSVLKIAVLAVAGILLSPPVAHAQPFNPDTIGLTLLRATTTNLDGTGIRVAQPEEIQDGNPQEWEVDPASAGRPTSIFSFASDLGSTTIFPNAVGSDSMHAGYVGQIFYGILPGGPDGVATNIAHVDSFDMTYFCNLVSSQTQLNDVVVNQSFTFDEQGISNTNWSDSAYDDYIARFGILFVSAAGNDGITHGPSTCYNGISVAAYGGFSAIGPTSDNGRCKPDITAPYYVTSFSTPQVSGAAAVLMQAALRGDGGSTNAAFNLRTIKALLLNGAVKPADWTNSISSPLDYRYGAGVLNIFNSYRQLTGGRHASIVSNLVNSGNAHLPTGATGTVSALNSWDFSTNSSSATQDKVKHYYFNATNSPGNFICTATLVWNRHLGKTNINNLDLFLYNCANSNLVACSTSLVDNVEHIFVPRLAPGRYDLQVWKAGGAGIVSTSETYALAWQFAPENLNLTRTGTCVQLSWPAYPAGFMVETTTDPADTAWSSASLPDVTLTNNTNNLQLMMTNAFQFFRLRSPDF